MLQISAATAHFKNTEESQQTHETNILTMLILPLRHRKISDLRHQISAIQALIYRNRERKSDLIFTMMHSSLLISVKLMISNKITAIIPY